ncbi:uncharacterized protein DFL_009303 [Arthrobotrys flagrans]|uniref:Uncharacterized protein n=1 Tax=Arthrobotrys flagrans TaxID=97331 RepID=A0A436ZR98_ARTFL|nr:hypothetical protein DFL_009303 [Arthrobotrys flagrans]
MSDTQKEQAITQIANDSKLLRNAIAAAIPVAPEQFFTVSIPGTVIDVRYLKNGGTVVYDQETAIVPPFAVRQAEARLVDTIMPLANIGNMGESVARSYNRALDGLLPRKVDVKTGGNQIRSPGENSYIKATEYLTS